MANSLAIEFKQESFGVEIDGTLYFFKPAQVYRQRYEEMKKKSTAKPGTSGSGSSWRSNFDQDSPPMKAQGEK
jgi:hypothetical protein